jgi:hypothetical protein
MAKSNKANRGNGVLNFLRTGGQKAPPDLKNLRLEAARQSIQQRLAQEGGTRRQGARFRDELYKKSNPIPNDPASKKALDGLLAIHQKLASKKIVAPAVAAELGGILAGRITAKVTPPFDYALSIPTVISGQTVLKSTANVNGQISASAVTSFDGRNAGSMYSEVGIYFHPMAVGTLRVSASPAFAFQWWTNSLNAQSPVRSFGSGGLTVYSLDLEGHIGGLAGANVDIWDEEATDQIQFDIGSSVQIPVSVQLQVTPSLVYLLFVSVDAHVEGIGWPGSLAGSVASMTLPSITYEFDQQLVFAPF